MKPRPACFPPKQKRREEKGKGRGVDRVNFLRHSVSVAESGRVTPSAKDIPQDDPQVSSRRLRECVDYGRKRRMTP